MRRSKSLGRPAVWVAVAWAAFFALAAWLWGTRLSAVIHPPVPWVPVGLAVLLITALVAAVLSGGWRLVRGPRRGRAGLAVVVGLMPAAAVWWLGNRFDKQVRSYDLTPTAPLALGVSAFRNFAAVMVPIKYPQRLDGDKVVLFHDGGAADPAGDVRKADEFVRSAEVLAGRPTRARIHWVRGSVVGVGGPVPQPGFAHAWGRPDASTPAAEAGMLSRSDRRELADAVLVQRTFPGPPPPSALAFGFTIAVVFGVDAPGPPNAALRFRSLVDDMAALDPSSPEHKDAVRENWLYPHLDRLAGQRRGQGDTCALCADLFHPDEFYQERVTASPVAGAFTTYLLRRFEPARPGAFGDFASRVRPGTAEATFREVYSVTLAEAERDFWADCKARVAAP